MKYFLEKNRHQKIRQPKSSPSVTDSMVSTSQLLSLHQTISPFRATGTSHVSLLSWFGGFTFFSCFLLCQSCQLSYPFHPFPKGRLLCILMHKNDLKSICLQHIYVIPRKAHSFNIVHKILECSLEIFLMFYSLSLNIHPKLWKTSRFQT